MPMIRAGVRFGMIAKSGKMASFTPACLLGNINRSRFHDRTKQFEPCDAQRRQAEYDRLAALHSSPGQRNPPVAICLHSACQGSIKLPRLAPNTERII